MTYKPCTTAQYRIMEYLRKTFETSLCLIYPCRPNAMVLEDQFGEKLEFFFRDGKVLEHPLMPPADSAPGLSVPRAQSADVFRTECPLVHRCLSADLPAGPWPSR